MKKTFVNGIKQEGIEEGIVEGITLGTDIQLIKLICKKLRKGKTAAEIAEILEEDENKIKALSDIASKYAPEYDEDSVINDFKQMNLQYLDEDGLF